MKKKEIGEGIVQRVDYPNKGRILMEDGTRVTVKNVIPGQKVRFRVIQHHENRMRGKLLETLEKSPLESRSPLCGIFPECGGCIYQSIPYEKQLDLKTRQVMDLISPFFDEDTVFDGIRKSPDEFGYRNKMEFSFGNEFMDGPLTLGLHRRGTTYDVLTADDCVLVHKDFQKILRCTLDYCTARGFKPYNKVRHTGLMRFLLIRRSHATGELLVCLVTTSDTDHDFDKWKEELQELPIEGTYAGILHAICDNPSDNVSADSIRTLYGCDFFYESLLGLRFKVSLFSFFQTNSAGAEVLYETVRDYVGQDHRNVLYDLYCGTGTIAQLLSKNAGKVYGIELVEEAVEAACVNAKMNDIDNCEFIGGNVLEKIDEIPEKPDYIILDPPREGIVPKALMKIIELHVPQMVYISCKASSLEKDLRVLKQYGWHVKRISLVDLFPETSHVETCALLVKESDNEA